MHALVICVGMKTSPSSYLEPISTLVRPRTERGDAAAQAPQALFKPVLKCAVRKSRCQTYSEKTRQSRVERWTLSHAYLSHYSSSSYSCQHGILVSPVRYLADGTQTQRKSYAPAA